MGLKSAAHLIGVCIAVGVLWAAGAAAAQPALKVEAVVRLVRHGVRPPTKDPAMPTGVAADPWPSWTVAPGFLTPHGAQAMRALGQADRAAYASAGLVGAAGCPDAQAVSVWADVDERTVKSAEAWIDGFAPGCGLKAGHAAGGLDPLFSPVETGAVAFDPAKAEAAIAARLPPGGLDALAKAHGAEIGRLGEILGCCSRPLCDTFKVTAPCTLGDLPSAIRPTKGSRPKLSGPLDYGSTASEILLLEYGEGKPAAQVGWGRATRADIEQVLALHPLQFDILVRSPYVAAANASGLARRILAALDPAPAAGAKITILLGHDTNIASLGGLLDLHWRVAGFPADDPPPGGSLGFERLSDSQGHLFVRAFYESQTLDQLRTAGASTSNPPPYKQVLAIPLCSTPEHPECALDRFETLVQSKLAPQVGG
jgi:4-phytase/acid phosphatase